MRFEVLPFERIHTIAASFLKFIRTILACLLFLHQNPLFDMLMDDFSGTQIDVTRAALLVNGLGRTTRMELLLVARQVHKHLKDRGVAVEFVDAGEFATSLNMHGFSISLMALDDELALALLAPAQSDGFSL